MYVSLLSDNCRDLQEISQNLNRNVPQIRISKIVQLPRQDISSSTGKSSIETKPNDSNRDCPETMQFPNTKISSKCTLNQTGIEESKRVNDELDFPTQLPSLGFTDFKQRTVLSADTDQISSREVLDFCITADLPQVEVQTSQACPPTLDSSSFISKATVESEVQHTEHDTEENILDTLGVKVPLDSKLVKIDGDNGKDRSSHSSKALNSAPSTPIEITFESSRQAEATQAVENITKNPANARDDRDDEEVLGALVQLSTECTVNHHRSLESSDNIVEANGPKIKLNRSEESATHCDSLGTNDAELQELHESVSKTQPSAAISTASEATIVSQNSRNPDRRDEGILEIPTTETLLNNALEAIRNLENKNDNEKVSEAHSQSSAVDSVKLNQNAFPSDNFDESGICVPADVLSSQAENRLMIPEKRHASAVNMINIQRFSVLSTNLDETRTDGSIPIPSIMITDRCTSSNVSDGRFFPESPFGGSQILDALDHDAILIGNKTIIETEAHTQARQSEGQSTDIPQTKSGESSQPPYNRQGSPPVSSSVKQSVFMENVTVQGNNTSSEYLQNTDKVFSMSFLTDDNDDEWLPAGVEYMVCK